ncbi:MAG: hypothetical protein PHE60_03785 [Sulfurospirillaceae bacterium]|nr:hypothetical protein [Sulfurospirillaceae bacterium]
MKSTLANLIKREYLKSIILPLLVVETMLLIAYFWSNSFVTDATKNTLIAETKVNIKEISLRSATIINNDFKAIAKRAELFQNQHENFFKEYNPLHVSLQDNSYTTIESGVISNQQKNKIVVRFFILVSVRMNPIDWLKPSLLRRWTIFTMLFSNQMRILHRSILTVLIR